MKNNNKKLSSKYLFLNMDKDITLYKINSSIDECGSRSETRQKLARILAKSILVEKGANKYPLYAIRFSPEFLDASIIQVNDHYYNISNIFDLDDRNEYLIIKLGEKYNAK